MHPPTAVRERLTGRRRSRLVAVLTAVVLGANAFVLGSGWSDVGQTDVASAAVSLASTAEPAVEAVLDPLVGIVLDIPAPADVDPAVELPVPEPAPANPYEATPEIAHGLLEIPAIGLAQTLFEGVSLTSINRGPSHWPGTAMPGEVGNVVVAGHRTTYSKPFWSLDELQPGDELIFTIDDERIVYELDRTEIVSPTDVHIVDQTHERRATLFACHPRGSARQRIVGHFTMKAETVQVEVFDTIGQIQPVRNV